MDITEHIEKLYRAHFGNLVLHTLQRFQLNDVATAEDVVQEAFSIACKHWTTNFPAQPLHWLYGVCRNIACKKSLSTIDLSTVGEDISDSEASSSHLGVLWAIAGSPLAPKVQVLCALRFVSGLKTARIAQLLGMQHEAVTKSLARAKTQLAPWFKAQTAIQITHSTERLSSVLKIVYMLFTEGYSMYGLVPQASEGLCEDAVSLLNEIEALPFGATSESKALRSLFLFQLARLESRLDKQGCLIHLEQQDRTLWNKEMIRAATVQLHAAATATPGTYHLEAAIAYTHCSAPSLETTDWEKIFLLYDRLYEIYPSPFVQLSKAAALLMADRNEVAALLLTELGRHPFMQYHLYYQIALMKLYRTEPGKLEQHRQIALSLTQYDAQRDYINRYASSSTTETNPQR